MDSVGFMNLLVSVGFGAMLGLYAMAMRRISRSTSALEVNLSSYRAGILVASMLPSIVVMLVLSQFTLTSAPLSASEVVAGSFAATVCLIGIALVIRAGKRERGMIDAYEYGIVCRKAIIDVPIDF